MKNHNFILILGIIIIGLSCIIAIDLLTNEYLNEFGLLWRSLINFIAGGYVGSLGYRYYRKNKYE